MSKSFDDFLMLFAKLQIISEKTIELKIIYKQFPNVFFL